MNQQDKDLLFKALFGYLPYELKMHEYYKDKQLELTGLISTECTAERFKGTPSINLCFKDGSAAQWNEYYQLTIKPILKPLSDYKDINGKAMNDLNIDISDQIDLSQFADEHWSLHSIGFGIIEICQRNHIDYLGLLDKDLAVSIHDVNK